MIVGNILSCIRICGCHDIVAPIPCRACGEVSHDRAVASVMQVVTSVGSVKYLYKYVEKGPDRAMVNVASKSMPAPEPEPDAPRDEIREYEDARVLGSSMCAWKLMGFKMHGRFPAVQRLDVHMAGEHYMVYEEGTERAAYRAAKEVYDDVDIDKVPSSTLNAWFAYLRLHHALAEVELARAIPEARRLADTLCFTLKYHEFPRHYKYDKKVGMWSRREGAPKRNDKSIGLVYPVPVNQGIYFMRMLLVSLRGGDLLVPANCQSFTHAALRYVPDTNGALRRHARIVWRTCVVRGGMFGSCSVFRFMDTCVARASLTFRHPMTQASLAIASPTRLPARPVGCSPTTQSGTRVWRSAPRWTLVLLLYASSSAPYCSSITQVMLWRWSRRSCYGSGTT